MVNTLHRCYLISVLSVLCGCASIDFDHPKTASTALPPEQTTDANLGRMLEGLADAHLGQAGFLPINDGVEAVAIRLLMAEQAEHSIDTQYYLIKDDLVGHLFIESLLRAADRGVRVRLLVDDIKTKGYDAGMAALNSHPNFEVRVFNPFARRSARLIDGVTRFARVNRRMHNKSFTVDNQMMLIGGRNIADEYFAARLDVSFGDLDVVSIGPVVADVSEMFDVFWNSRAAVPVTAFTEAPDNPDQALSQLREQAARTRAEASESKYADAVRSSMLETIRQDLSIFTWASYQLVYDSPDKWQRKKAKDAASIRTPLIEAFDNAKKEILIISPYFVPRSTGIARFQELRDRGVDARVVTNSLAATNQSFVHGGYAPSRKPLLKMGVKLYEVRADASVAGHERVGSDADKITLHTKAFAIDRERLFIGSFNFDPRSAYINTEMGVIINSPELAGDFVTRGDEAIRHKTYAVFRNENAALRWRGLEDDKEIILTKEPQTGFWQRFVAGFMRLLPIRGQL